MRRNRAITVATALATIIVTGGVPGSPAAAAPGAGPDTRNGRVSAPPAPAIAAVPEVPGLTPVAPSSQPIPAPLPQRDGTLAPTAPPGTASKSAPAARSMATSNALAAGTVAPSTRKVELRALVVGTGPDDFGVATWTSMLDRVGAAYTVLDARTAPITSTSLVSADGVGKYNAVLLTNSMMLVADGNGGYGSAVTPDSWNALWGYERDFGVRQAVLYASYGSWPEDYCLRAGSEGPVTDVVQATLADGGATVFKDLKAGAQVPITQSWVYRNSLDPSCGGQPLLTLGSDVLGSVSVSPDGRERAALSFTSNQYLLQSDVLAYGLFQWASRGLFLGDQRHYLKLDIDDWFGTSSIIQPDRTIQDVPGYSLTGHDAYNLSQQQTALNTAYPLAANFKATLAYNGEGANQWALSRCSPTGGVNTLSATTKCVKTKFEFINHTYSHPKMNSTSYWTSSFEIGSNFAVDISMWLNTPTNVLKTGEYSGLGVYNPDPNNDIDPPTDYGLAASNPNLLRAARDNGVQFMHGNMSFASHRPSCFNCSTPHPMQPSISIVPDWPSNIAYFSSTPTEEETFYNWYYGPGGKFPYWSRDLTYPEILDAESTQALSRLAQGSMYTTTMHIANVRDYGNGNTLATDWLTSVTAKYSSLYSVPLVYQSWPSLGAATVDRTSHYALKNNVRAVYDPVTKTVTVSSRTAGRIVASGVAASGWTAYGQGGSATFRATATATSYPAKPLS